MSLRRGLAPVAIALVCSLAAGCGGDTSAADEVALGRETTASGGVGEPDEGFATLRRSQQVVLRTMRSAAQALQGDGMSVEFALGGAEVCASTPTEAAEYGAYARLGGGSGPVETQLEAAADRMVAAGWEIEERRGGEDPAYRLSQGPEAAVGLGIEEREDGSAVRFGVQGPCLRVEGPGLAEFADEELELG